MEMALAFNLAWRSLSEELVGSPVMGVRSGWANLIAGAESDIWDEWGVYGGVRKKRTLPGVLGEREKKVENVVNVLVLLLNSWWRHFV
jgi:hypothetical protein